MAATCASRATGWRPKSTPASIPTRTDAEGRKAAYVPLSRDGKVVDSSAVVERLKDRERS